MGRYATILANLDAAIANWAGRPLRVRNAAGAEVEYRSLRELMDARNEYAQLDAADGDGDGFRLTPLAHGDAK